MRCSVTLLDGSLVAGAGSASKTKAGVEEDERAEGPGALPLPVAVVPRRNDKGAKYGDRLNGNRDVEDGLMG